MKFFNDKKGVFGLNAVQQFFAIILGLALLAYVIVAIMGVLQGTTLLSSSSLGPVTVLDESFAFGDTVDNAGVPGFIATVINATNSTALIPASNYTLSSAGVITNNTAGWSGTLLVSYTYKYNDVYANNANGILGNVSTGITGFFSAINPVYAILAILVIILILVVLVRVVQVPSQKGESVAL